MGFNLGKDGHPIGQIVSVLINTISVFIVALSLLDHLAESFVWVGAAGLLISFGGVLYYKAFPLLVYVSRVIVGGLFIVSGLIKANDPEGFAYKLHDYFAENALGMEVLDPYAIYFSITVAVGEIVLGVAAIVGGKMRLTAWTLLVLILFFSWLTFYTSSCLETQKSYHNIQGNINSGDKALLADEPDKATILYEYAAETLDGLGSTYQDSLSPAIQSRLNYVKNGEYQNGDVDSTLASFSVVPFWRECVDDCGCFGDALKGSVGRSLYPWESFAKDAVLLYFVLMIFFYQARIRLNNYLEDMFLMGGSLLVVIFLCVVLGNWFFPLLFSIVLFGLALLIKRYSIKMDKEWLMAIVVTLAALGFALYTYSYLPIKDYRAYAVGNDLREQMSNGVPQESEQIFVYLHVETRELREVDNEELNQSFEELAEHYVMLSREDRIIKEGRLASLVDFKPTKTYGELSDAERSDSAIISVLSDDALYPLHKVLYLEEYEMYDTVSVLDYDPEYYPDSMYTFVKEYRTEPGPDEAISFINYIVGQEKIILIVSKKLDGMNPSAIEDMVKLAHDAEKAGTPVYILTSSGDADISSFRKKHDLGPIFLIQDETELKIVVRSNPGVLYLENAVVIDKWSSWSIPDYEDLGD